MAPTVLPPRSPASARDLDAVRRRARDLGHRVTALVPAHNEAATIADVVAGLARAGDLLDDLVVVDSDSTDGTAAVAAAAGARVVRQREVLAEAGPGAGKGEALWKGLAATGGDLVVVADGDLRGVDERYVAGLVAPLLQEPDVVFVKAAADRSAGPDGVAGGRVTELLARPLLAAWWPELAGLVQPLAGEFAVRRDAIESVPLVQGYGVDLALAVDLADRFGAHRIRQVDLGVRVHRNRPLPDLGRMAAEILRAATSRLRSQGRGSTPEGPTTILQPVRGPDGRLRSIEWDVPVAERPPLASVRAATVGDRSPRREAAPCGTSTTARRPGT